ncbi:hypothetical protein [Aliarcobacter butzleri]|uniref:hypothetical protein n=1 Tax=Aliarcobacter butzleri TaxID=28197 RepID=UPI002B244BB3|nr:hypothetical protein [Aliarcobacter butzleri]
MKKFNIYEKVGLWFLNNIDKNALIFNTLKSQKILLRFFIYIFLIVSSFLTLNLLNNIIIVKASSCEFLSSNLSIFINILTFLEYFILFIESTIIFYEFIFKYPIEELKKYKEEKKKIFAKFYIRLFIYIVLFFIIIQFIYIVILNYNLSNINNLNFQNEIILSFNSKEEQLLFEKNFNLDLSTTLTRFYNIYFLSIFIIEFYLLRKNYNDNKC